jgi:uncharacterized protein YciI
MFIVLLRFSHAKPRARELMAGHEAWIARGFADGVFLLTGSLLPNLGGAVLAGNVARADLEARVREDPFVIHDVVTAELFEVAAGRTRDELAFLLAPRA